MPDVAAFLAEHADDDVCRLVTTGRRSGRRHDVEIWFGVAGEQLTFIAGNGPTCDWYRNALADPAVEVRLGDVWLAGPARDAAGDDRRLVGGLSNPATRIERALMHRARVHAPPRSTIARWVDERALGWWHVQLGPDDEFTVVCGSITLG